MSNIENNKVRSVTWHQRQSSTPQTSFPQQRACGRCPAPSWAGWDSPSCPYQLGRYSSVLDIKQLSAAHIPFWLTDREQLTNNLHDRYRIGMWSVDILWSLFTPISRGPPLLFTYKQVQWLHQIKRCMFNGYYSFTTQGVCRNAVAVYRVPTASPG